MGCITKRSHPNGRITYRVHLKRHRKGHFSITFDDYDAACDWLKEHEQNFRENPDFYFKWRENLADEYRRKEVRVLNHILLPKLKGK